MARRTLLAPAICLLALCCGGIACAADPISEDDAVAVTAVVQDHLKAKDLTDIIRREGQYAVAVWAAQSGVGPGEALLKKTQTGWILLRQDGSLRSAETLENLGVPPATAQKLVKDLAAMEK